MFNIRSLLSIIFASSLLFSASATLKRRQCSSSLSDEEVEEAEAHFAQNSVYYASKSADRQDVIEVNVYFNVISDDDEDQTGSVSNDTINTQMDVMNDSYRDVGITFNLQNINRVVNSTWFNNAGNKNARTKAIQTDMKQAIRKGGPGDLYIYSVGFTAEDIDGLLGYATFPYKYQNNTLDDGIVIAYTSLPGVDNEGPYNQGKTLVHETGHWLGLYHVFRGKSCTGRGDYVDDTPPQLTATYDCPLIKDTCLGGGPDSIHNYMDYSDDACLNSFTQGQITRLMAQIARYRNLTS